MSSANPPPDEVYPISKLGEYQIIKDIAEGTFGIVKMARHTVTDQIVAMKFLSKALIHQSKTKHRVQREVEYMRALRHPHIIKLYEVINTPSHIIIVLEYAGGELFRYIAKNGRMQEPLARRFFQQLISGLEFSHKLKIVHRDLKPENVLLDQDLNVKIADFGLSNEIQDGAFLKTSCGSPNYAAPEVINAGLYTGPEIDVWSSGVILYVMLCGALPFEDDDVKSLFSKITHGTYHTPSHLSPDARSLISEMLQIDPLKRITIPQITQHPFYTTSLPRYLTPLPPPPGPVIGHLSSLVAPANNPCDFEIIPGLGKIEEDIVAELATRVRGVDKEAVLDALRRDDAYGAQGNAVKVAYTLLRDKRRGANKTLEEREEAQRDAYLAAMDPRNAISPGAVSPGGHRDLDTNPFDSQFGNEPVPPGSPGDETTEAESDAEDISFSPADSDTDHTAASSTLYQGSPSDASAPTTDTNNFSVLNTSLPQSHYLASYASAKARSSMAKTRERGERRGGTKATKWHFGIRSRSPPMEVMLEIYRTLKALGMEWKEKKWLGGLGIGAGRKGYGGRRGDERGIERASELDGDGEVDMKAAKEIYFIETRARMDDVVVLMNIQLYSVDSINFLVDFHHKKSYRASTLPDAGKFDVAPPVKGQTLPDFTLNGHSPSDPEDEAVVSPFVFMDCACRLILELAGGGQ